MLLRQKMSGAAPTSQGDGERYHFNDLTKLIHPNLYGSYTCMIQKCI